MFKLSRANRILIFLAAGLFIISTLANFRLLMSDIASSMARQGKLLISEIIGGLAKQTTSKQTTPKLCDDNERFYDFYKALENPEKACFLQITGWGELLPAIGNLKNLKELHITSTNYLETLPPEIGNLSNLVILDLTFNRDLKELPPELYRLEKLEQLLLGNNKLSRLPAGISALKNLKALRLDNNDLVCLPSDIGELPNLETLYIGNNNLMMLPPSITRLTKLKTLSEYLNPLTLDQTPSEFLLSKKPSSDFDVQGEKTEVFKRFVKEGEGVTHLARRIIDEYLYGIGFFETNSLTQDQETCLEDHLQNSVATEDEWLDLGETRSFSSSLLKEAFGICKIKINNICP